MLLEQPDARKRNRIKTVQCAPAVSPLGNWLHGAVGELELPPLDGHLWWLKDMPRYEGNAHSIHSSFCVKGYDTS